MKKYNMKKFFTKKIIISVIGVGLLFRLFFPMRYELKDGGTIVYESLIYSIYKVHSLANPEDMENGKMYNEGLVIEILGQEIHNTVQ